MPALGRIIAALCLMCVCTGAALAEARIALVIGNSDYQQTGWSLANPSGDAELVALALENVGFDVQLLVDADKDQMEDAATVFSRSLRAAGEDAIGLFYFAGHGIQLDGLNYLVPVDIEANTQQDIWSGGFPFARVLDAMQRGGGRLNIAILDACRNNPLPSRFRSAGGSGLARVELDSTRGLLLAYATSPGMTAADGAGAANGPYASALARYISTPGLPAEIMFKRVAEAVEQTTEGVQQPFYESGLRGAEFYFAGGAPEGGGFVSGPAPAPVTGPASIDPTVILQQRKFLKDACIAEVPGEADEYCSCSAKAVADALEPGQLGFVSEMRLAGVPRETWSTLAGARGLNWSAIEAALAAGEAAAADTCGASPKSPFYEAASLTLELLKKRRGLGGQRGEDVILSRAAPEDFLFFADGSSELSEEGEVALQILVNRAVQVLAENPNWIAQPAGACARNEGRLSICGQRGVNIYDALQAAGVPHLGADRQLRGAISAGKNNLLTNGETEADLAIHRYAWVRFIDRP